MREANQVQGGRCRMGTAHHTIYGSGLNKANELNGVHEPAIQ
ncbi:MAG: hypothetical protein ACLFVT_08465 [Syntrophobacteria bacterium]